MLKEPMEKLKAEKFDKTNDKNYSLYKYIILTDN